MRRLKSHIAVLVIICLGFFIAPANGYACGVKRHVTETQQDSKCHMNREEKSCPCGKGCDGKCGHKSCKCDGCCCSVALVTPVITKSGQQFAVSRKLKYPPHQAGLSSGFNFIWLPPKLSYNS